MYFSVIIPAWNCIDTLERLLDSVVRQNQDSLEVIFVDDKSTQDYTEILNKYSSKLNISKYETIRNVHCPGNTRQVGLEHAKGDWITFIDNDDMFEDGIFDKVKAYIEAENIQTVVATKFREYDIEKHVYTQYFDAYESMRTWLHGKWYNRKNVIDKYKAHFCEDLKSHEDVFFNVNILTHMEKEDQNLYNVLDEYSYKWIKNPNSLSRSFSSDKYIYIEEYLTDYIYASTAPIFECFKDAKEDTVGKFFAIDQLMAVLLCAYFYYQGSRYRLGAEIKEDNLLALRRLIFKIRTFTGFSFEQITDCIYANPIQYDIAKQQAEIGCGAFIEMDSFRDFMKYMTC